ncbi:MAG: AAA family ATPase [Candidatus Tectomicrobia bacterium]|nr:AAA family ATPase [Candidatus Tectomicrobia bacterium]
MYLDFYGLRKAPFQITPDPDFLFLSPSHKVALGAIIYGIEDRQGFVAITGAVGLGKTTILRSYLERIDPQQLRTICIFNANVSFQGLLKAIYAEFDLDTPPGDLYDQVKQLHQALIEEYQRGRNIALIIDEAQNMPMDTLANLRMLSNLETATEKLLQIVLIGQPEFEHILNRPELQQLKQCLVIQETIDPLTPKESLAYIHHRLDKVRTHNEPIFTRHAENLLVSAAKGTPRVLNTLCTNALITGVGYQEKPVSAKTAKQVVASLLGKSAPARRSHRWLYGIAATVLAILLLGLLWLSPVGPTLIAKVTDHPPTPIIEWRETIVTNWAKLTNRPNWPNWAKLKELNPFSSSTTTPGTTESRPERPQVAAVPKLPDAVVAATPAVAAPNRPQPSDVIPEATQSPTNDNPVQTALSNPMANPIANPVANPVANPAANASTPNTSPSQMSDSQSAPNSNAEAAAFPITISVSPGEDISSIAEEIYGFANDDLFQLIKKSNPRIRDLKKIKIGDRIILPALPAAFDKFLGTG